MVPLVRTAEGVRNALAAIRYPPDGTLGFGYFIAQNRWDTALMAYREKMQPELVNCILVETACLAAGIPLRNVALAKPRAEALFAHGYRNIAGFDMIWMRAKAEEAHAWLSG